MQWNWRDLPLTARKCWQKLRRQRHRVPEEAETRECEESFIFSFFSLKNHSFFLSSAWRIIHFFFLQPEESFIFSFNRKRQPTIWRCPNDVGTFSAQTSVARQAATRFHPRFKITRRFPSLMSTKSPFLVATRLVRFWLQKIISLSHITRRVGKFTPLLRRILRISSTRAEALSHPSRHTEKPTPLC